MVDPNRKINRLTAEDIAFLDECEQLFANRFTDSDDEFKLHCEKVEKSEPPVVMNFSGGDRGGGPGNQRQNRPYRGGRGGNQRGYNRREGYNRRGGSGSGGGGDGRFRHNYRPYRNYNERNDDRVMNVRREYGKFVAASHSDHPTSHRNARDGNADNG